MIAKKFDKLDHLSELDCAYIAGFLDGDGSILGQIVRDKTYKRQFRIKIALVFYQKKSRSWFLESLKKQIGYGNLRSSKIEYTIYPRHVVYFLLKRLVPYLRIKKRLAILALETIEALEVVKTDEDFIEVCKKIDQFANHTDSKKRTVVATIVEEELRSPVET